MKMKRSLLKSFVKTARGTEGRPSGGRRRDGENGGISMQVRHLNLSVGRSTANTSSSFALPPSMAKASAEQKLRVAHSHLDLTLPTGTTKQRGPSGSPPPSLPPSPPLGAQPDAFGCVLRGVTADAASRARSSATAHGVPETKQRRWRMLHRLFSAA